MRNWQNAKDTQNRRLENWRRELPSCFRLVKSSCASLLSVDFFHQRHIRSSQYRGLKTADLSFCVAASMQSEGIYIEENVIISKPDNEKPGANFDGMAVSPCMRSCNLFDPLFFSSMSLFDSLGLKPIPQSNKVVQAPPLHAVSAKCQLNNVYTVHQRAVLKCFVFTKATDTSSQSLCL